jgi:hypothetical protein
LRRDLKGRARDWNWHNVIGIWIAVPLFVIALTGVIMAYSLANDLLYHLTGNAPPPRQNETVTRERGVEHTSGQKNRHVTETVTNLDAPFALAEMQVAGWHTTILRLSNPGANALVFQVDCGDGGRPDLRTQVTVDSSGSRLLRVEPFSGNNPGTTTTHLDTIHPHRRSWRSCRRNRCCRNVSRGCSHGLDWLFTRLTQIPFLAEEKAAGPSKPYRSACKVMRWHSVRPGGWLLPWKSRIS